MNGGDDQSIMDDQKCARCKGNGRVEMLEHCPGCFGTGANIDPGIRERVGLLLEAGFKTTASCEGGDGHAFRFPTVQVDGKGNLPAVRAQLIRWLQKRGEAGSVSEHYLVQPTRIMDESYVQIEWWTD